MASFGRPVAERRPIPGETWDALCRKIVETLPEEVYVSFDIDGLSFENCPPYGNSGLRGLSFNEAVWLLDTLVRSGRRIVGFDLVEVCPSPEGRIDAITGARMLWKALRTDPQIQ